MEATPRRRLPFLFMFLPIVLLAAALRLPGLESRPMHVDEAVHAVKLGELLETGVYVYDRSDYHGPTLYYATLPVLAAMGIRDLDSIPGPMALRLTSAFVGVLLVLALLFLKNVLSRGAILISGLLTAVSPAFVFYSRYFIQEMILVLLTLVFMGAAWRWISTGRVRWPVICGILAGLMAATKETWFLSVGCMALAALINIEMRHQFDLNLRTGARNAIIFGAAALAVSALLITNFFTAPQSLQSLFGAYSIYFSRGVTGTISSGPPGIHDHPWWFYGNILIFFKNGPGPWWSEGLIVLLGIIGGTAVFRRGEASCSFGRWLAVYAVLVFLCYSMIPYKTPWLVLNILLPLIMLAGIGVDVTLSKVKSKAGLRFFFLLLGAGIAHLGYQSWRASHRFEADPRNPYVYAHTTPTFKRLVDRIGDLAAANGNHVGVRIDVIESGANYWPLPWELRKYPNVGYWNEVPAGSDAPIVIAGPALSEKVREILGEDYVEEFYGLRPGVILRLHIRNDLWEKLIRSREGAADAP